MSEGVGRGDGPRDHNKGQHANREAEERPRQDRIAQLGQAASLRGPGDSAP